MTKMNETIGERMRATTEAFLQTWTGNWVDALNANLELRAPECSHTILPSSLGRKNEANDVWASKFSKVMSLITESTMTLEDYISVSVERRAVARSSLKAQSPVGPYENDYVWFLTFDDAGEKIVKIVEFVDGLAAKELLGKLKEWEYLR